MFLISHRLGLKQNHEEVKQYMHRVHKRDSAGVGIIYGQIHYISYSSSYKLPTCYGIGTAYAELGLAHVAIFHINRFSCWSATNNGEVDSLLLIFAVMLSILNP